MDEAKLKMTVGKNIIRLRKGLNWTQAELAEQLNYTDKAISKWERGEALPDIYILMKLAELFHVTLDTLLTEEAPLKKVSFLNRKKKIIIPILGAGIVWVIATLVFVFMGMFAPELKKWMAFVVAIPCSFIVFIVFSAIWGRSILTAAFISGLMWTLALTLYLFFSFENRYLFFIIPVPLQILVVLWYTMRFNPNRKKRQTEPAPPKTE